ncbi:MAG: hypothetical protein ACR2JF_04130 [Iamia sp.]
MGHDQAGADHPRPPSGEQIVLVHGDQRATIVGVGAGIRTWGVRLR